MKRRSPFLLFYILLTSVFWSCGSGNNEGENENEVRRNPDTYELYDENSAREVRDMCLTNYLRKSNLHPTFPSDLIGIMQQYSSEEETLIQLWKWYEKYQNQNSLIGSIDGIEGSLDLGEYTREQLLRNMIRTSEVIQKDGLNRDFHWDLLPVIFKYISDPKEVMMYLNMIKQSSSLYNLPIDEKDKVQMNLGVTGFCGNQNNIILPLLRIVSRNNHHSRHTNTNSLDLNNYDSLTLGNYLECESNDSYWDRIHSLELKNIQISNVKPRCKLMKNTKNKRQKKQSLIEPKNFKNKLEERNELRLEEADEKTIERVKLAHMKELNMLNRFKTSVIMNYWYRMNTNSTIPFIMDLNSIVHQYSTKGEEPYYTVNKIIELIKKVQYRFNLLPMECIKYIFNLINPELPLVCTYTNNSGSLIPIAGTTIGEEVLFKSKRYRGTEEKVLKNLGYIPFKSLEVPKKIGHLSEESLKLFKNSYETSDFYSEYRRRVKDVKNSKISKDSLEEKIQFCLDNVDWLEKVVLPTKLIPKVKMKLLKVTKMISKHKNVKDPWYNKSFVRTAVLQGYEAIKEMKEKFKEQNKKTSITTNSSEKKTKKVLRSEEKPKPKKEVKPQTTKSLKSKEIKELKVSKPKKRKRSPEVIELERKFNFCVQNYARVKQKLENTKKDFFKKTGIYKLFWLTKMDFSDDLYTIPKLRKGIESSYQFTQEMLQE